ncbi:PstS family phosphate ABC transporter substrate-binding protein [Aeoliella mucimassa]|uniref:Phosphate-binding protein n=1 Tax=Aeoliella mucimassa TaxID=2527972 RepID=A0A518AJ95_9BACT|nr:PstS family phosphate ABC transporter substrate-binding protein [Aeoliella mucimassa]QDU54744.1 Phosphate-binding protein PstS precursor [Aeoliella mucimassa]
MQTSAGRWAAILTCTLTIVAGCGGRGGADVQLDGSSTVFPVSARVAENLRYEGIYIRVTVARSGTGGGMDRFSKGDIDICDASRAMKSGEAKACQEAGVEFEHFIVAYDGIAVCVNPKNTWCNGLTVKQLNRLFCYESEIQTWSDLNPEWPEKEINLFGPGVDSGTYDTFNEHVLGKGAKVRIGYTKSEEDNVLVNGVSQDEYALGYFGFGYFVENSTNLKVLGIKQGESGEYVVPTIESIRDKSYSPLSRPLYIYVNLKSFKNPRVAEFVEFYLNHADEAAVEERYVPITEVDAKENQRKLMALKASFDSVDAANQSADATGLMMAGGDQSWTP